MLPAAPEKMQGRPQLVRALIVHRELDIAEIYAKILCHRGHIVRVAESAEEAIEIASEFKPHAAVCDVLLPGRSGLDLDVWFATNQPCCRVLLVSADKRAFQMVEESRRQGHNHTILPLPIRVARILEFVAACRVN